MASHTAMPPSFGPALQLTGRSKRDTQAIVDDLAPDALVVVVPVDGSTAAPWLTNPRHLRDTLRHDSLARGLRQARVFTGPGPHGVALDVAGGLIQLRHRLRNSPVAPTTRRDLLERLDDLLEAHLAGLDHRRWRSWGPRLESLALGLPPKVPVAFQRWTGAELVAVDAHRAPTRLVVPGLGLPPQRIVGALQASRPAGASTLLNRRLLTAPIGAAVGPLLDTLPELSAHIVAHSTGALVTEMAWHQVFSRGSGSASEHSYVAVHAPLGGGLHTGAGGAATALTTWLRALMGVADVGIAEALARLDGSAVGTDNGLVSSVLGAMCGAVLVALMRAVDAPELLPGIASVGLDQRPWRGDPTRDDGTRLSWRTLLADNEVHRRNSALLRSRHRWMGHGVSQPAADGVSRTVDDGMVSVHAMQSGFPEGSRLSTEAPHRTHFDVFDDPSVVDAILEFPEPDSTAGTDPSVLCPAVIRELARRRGWALPDPGGLDALAARLGLDAPVADRPGHFLLGPSNAPLDTEEGGLQSVLEQRRALPPPAPFADALAPEPPPFTQGLLSYRQLHGLLYNPRWQPQEVEPAWCGITGAGSRRLIVPADATSSLWGLQEKVGVVVTAAHRRQLRHGRIAHFRSPAKDPLVEVVLVPLEPALDFLLDAWRGRVREAVTALLLDDPTHTRSESRPTTDAITVFLPNPLPQAPVRALAVAAIEGAIRGRQDAWRQLSVESATPAQRAHALLPFRLRLATTWKDDFLQLADALARSPELSAATDLPRIVPRRLAGRSLAGHGHAGARPIRLLGGRSSLQLTVARIADQTWRYTAMTPRGLLRLEHTVTPEMVDFMVSEARSSRHGPALSWLAILPPEVRRALRTTLHVEFVLDEHTERVPWEALCVDGAPLCIRGSVSRRARSWRDPAPRQEDAVLIVANPTGDLAGASVEGDMVAELFGGLLATPAELDRQPPGTAHPRPDVLEHRILTGAHRVVHIASHGRAGAVVLGRTAGGHEVVLTADDVRRAGHVPELVVLNCCSVEGDDFDRSNLARAFRDRGCRVVVGTGWAIDDRAGQAFAHALYDGLLSGETIAEAAFQARLAVRSEHPDLPDAHWTAYRIWGDPEWQLTVGSVGEPRLRRRDIDRIVTEAQAIDACITLLGMARVRGKRLVGPPVIPLLIDTLVPALLARLARVDLPVGGARRVCDGLPSAELALHLGRLLDELGHPSLDLG